MIEEDQASLVLKDQMAYLAWRVLKGREDLMEPLDPKDKPVQREDQDRVDLRVHEAAKELLAIRDSLDPLEIRDLSDSKAFVVNQESEEAPAFPDQQAHLVPLAYPVKRV